MNDSPQTGYHPNIKDADDGLYCFMTETRACGPGCMAYLGNLDVPEGEDYKGKQWAHCMLLVNAHRVGKHVAIVAVTADNLLKKFRTQAADAQRTNQSPPPNPK